MNSEIKKYFKNLDAILVSSWANIVYLTGYPGFSKDERECFLIITANKQYLITDGRYSQALKKLKDFEIIDTGAMHFLTHDHSRILKNLSIKKVGIEENNLTVSEYKSLKKSLRNTLNADLSKLRIIKNPEEVKNIKLACEIGDLAFDYILGKLKLGVSEKEIEEDLILFFKIKNADISFRPIVAFGENSSVPHHLSHDTKLQNNQIVLLDFGINLNNYCSDMSRTVFFGSASAEFKRIHNTVLEAQTKAIEFANGKSSMVNGKLLASDIDRVARDYIIKQGYPKIPHSVGHGIGIEVHEAPFIGPHSKEKIKPGMVFSVEPGIYIQNFGGVRIEDLVLATKNGFELISHANREIIEI